MVLAAALAASAAVAWLSLPHVFHAHSLADVKDDVVNPSVLARMLFEQDEALLQTTDVVHWWAFSVFIVFMNASFVVPSFVLRAKANPVTAGTTT
jgi:hypothetical protein